MDNEFVCRTCLQIVPGSAVVHLNEGAAKNQISLRQQLSVVIPELMVDVVYEPVVCKACCSTITKAFIFKKISLENDKTVFRYIKESANADVTLLTTSDLVAFVRKDINKEHSYSFAQKCTTDTSSTNSDDGGESCLNINESILTNLEVVMNQPSMDPSVYNSNMNEVKLPIKTKAERKEVTDIETEIVPFDLGPLENDVLQINRSINMAENKSEELKAKRKRANNSKSTPKESKKMKMIDEHAKVIVEPTPVAKQPLSFEEFERQIMENFEAFAAGKQVKNNKSRKSRKRKGTRWTTRARKRTVKPKAPVKSKLKGQEESGVLDSNQIESEEQRGSAPENKLRKEEQVKSGELENVKTGKEEQVKSVLPENKTRKQEQVKSSSSEKMRKQDQDKISSPEKTRKQEQVRISSPEKNKTNKEEQVKSNSPEKTRKQEQVKINSSEKNKTKKEEQVKNAILENKMRKEEQVKFSLPEKNKTKKEEQVKSNSPEKTRKQEQVKINSPEKNKTKKEEQVKSAILENKMRKEEQVKFSLPEKNKTKKEEQVKSNSPEKTRKQEQVKINSPEKNKTKKEEQVKSAILENKMRKEEQVKSSTSDNKTNKQEQTNATIPENNKTRKREVVSSSASDNSKVTENKTRKEEQLKSKASENNKMKKDQSRNDLSESNKRKKPSQDSPSKSSGSHPQKKSNPVMDNKSPGLRNSKSPKRKSKPRRKSIAPSIDDILSTRAYTEEEIKLIKDLFDIPIFKNYFINPKTSTDNKQMNNTEPALGEAAVPSNESIQNTETNFTIIPGKESQNIPEPKIVYHTSKSNKNDKTKDIKDTVSSSKSKTLPESSSPDKSDKMKNKTKNMCDASTITESETFKNPLSSSTPLTCPIVKSTAKGKSAPEASEELETIKSKKEVDFSKTNKDIMKPRKILYKFPSLNKNINLRSKTPSSTKGTNTKNENAKLKSKSSSSANKSKISRGASKEIANKSPNIEKSPDFEPEFVNMTDVDQMSFKDLYGDESPIHVVGDLDAPDENAKKRFVCKKCNKSFEYKSHYSVHLKSHVFKKMFACPICQKSFTQEKYMHSHLELHSTQPGIHQCELCFKNLSASTALKRHMRTHTGEKPHICEHCNKRFAQKIQLHVHMRTHTGQKPFKCNTCHAEFTQKSHLTGHVRIHTGEKPYKCDKCPKSFRKSYALRIHLNSHDLKPFQCKACNFLFKDKGVFERHISKHLMSLANTGSPDLKKKKHLTAVTTTEEDKKIDVLEQDVKEINMGISLSEQTSKDNAHNSDEDDYEDDEDFFDCKLCGKQFASNFSKKRHMRIHRSLFYN